MPIANLLSQEIPALDQGSTVAEGILIMGDYHVRHLPVLIEEEFKGLIDEDTLLDSDPTADIGSLLLHVFLCNHRTTFMMPSGCLPSSKSVYCR